MRIFRIFFRIIFILAILTLIVFGVIWNYSNCLVETKKEKIPEMKPGALGLSYEMYYTVTPGLKRIHVCFFQCDKPNGTVILLHGLGMNKNQVMPMVPELCKAGFNVFTLDFRGHGLSDGEKTTLGQDEVWELQEAIREIKIIERNPRGHRCLGIYGISLGAAVALLECNNLPVMAVAVDECYENADYVADRIIRQRVKAPEFLYPWIKMLAEYRLGVRYSDINPLASVVKWQKALLVIQSRDEKIIQRKDAMKIYKSARTNKKVFVSLPNVKREVINDETYIRIVVNFFKDNLRIFIPATNEEKPQEKKKPEKWIERHPQK